MLLVDLDGGRRALPASILDEVRRLPGVVSASVSTHTPLSGSTWGEPALPAGQPLPERDTAIFVGASPGFFATLRIAARRRPRFRRHRHPASRRRVAIVNERYAQQIFPGRNPIGASLSAIVRGERQDAGDRRGREERQDVRRCGRRRRATVYVPYAQLAGDVPTNLECGRAAGWPISRQRCSSCCSR